MVLALAALAVLLVSIKAAPTSNGGGSAPQCRTIAANANFDDLDATPIGTINVLPTPYKGIYFQAFGTDQSVNIPLTPRVEPHSPKNYAAVNFRTQTRSGTAMMTTNYPNSNVKSFRLESFYFAIVLALNQGATQSPQAGLISVTGYVGNDNQVSEANQVCSQQYRYNPSTSLGTQQMAFGGLKDCHDKDLQFAIFTFQFEGGMSALTTDAAMYVDDIKYTYKECA